MGVDGRRLECEATLWLANACCSLVGVDGRILECEFEGRIRAGDIVIDLWAVFCPLAVREGFPNGESALVMSSSLQVWKSRELQEARWTLAP